MFFERVTKTKRNDIGAVQNKPQRPEGLKRCDDGQIICFVGKTGASCHSGWMSHYYYVNNFETKWCSCPLQ